LATVKDIVFLVDFFATPAKETVYEPVSEPHQNKTEGPDTSANDVETVARPSV
jgi:hypothetical protein